MGKLKKWSKQGRRWVKLHQPCPVCDSKDAFSIDSEGWGKCFSCMADKKVLDKDEKVWYSNLIEYPIEQSFSSVHSERVTSIMVYTKQLISYRALTVDTLRFYNSSVRVAEDGKPLTIEFPYNNGAIKLRSFENKNFSWEGEAQGAFLYGMDKFAPASGQAITITEGEIDCMSVFQMFGSKYPVVSVRNAQGARSDCEKAHKYLNSFDKIYLAFDNDEPGQKAAAEVAKLFDVNKVYLVEMGGGCKDANDYLTKGRQAEFVRAWWNAKKFLPKNIVNSYDQIKEVLSRESAGSVADYPFSTLQDMTYGIRFGEVNLFTAQEKVGKTEIMRAIEHHLLKTTDYNMAIIHLEEAEKRSVQGLLSYELGVPVHLPDCSASVDEQLKSYEGLTKRDGRLHFYTHFGSDDPDTILDTIRYLVSVCHCKFVFLDHITMLVTGFEGDDERKKLDYISTRLAMLTRELDFTLFLVSHVNDNGQTRGSRNISKVADLIVHLERNNEADDFDTRNTTHLMVKGNRFAGKSGPAGYLLFDPHTYMVKEKTLDGEPETTISPF